MQQYINTDVQCINTKSNCTDIHVSWYIDIVIACYNDWQSNYCILVVKLNGIKCNAFKRKKNGTVSIHHCSDSTFLSCNISLYHDTAEAIHQYIDTLYCYNWYHMIKSNVYLGCSRMI